MRPHVMIDLETMGTLPGSALLSIGGVKFLPSGEIWHEFHIGVSLQSCLLQGLQLQQDTLAWWRGGKQAAAAAEIASMDAAPLERALADLAYWLMHDEKGARTEKPITWCKGASFDFPQLRMAIAAIGDKAQEEFWDFWDERCCRTLFKVAADTHGFVLAPNPGLAHTALADARHQAEQVIACLRLLQAPRRPARKR